jgi:hypothetical protein
MVKRYRCLLNLLLLFGKYPVESKLIDRPMSLRPHKYLRWHSHSHKEPSGCMDSEGTCKHHLWSKDGSPDPDGHFHTINSRNNNNSNNLLRLYLRLHPRDLSGLMDTRDNKMHLRVRPRLSPMEQNRCVNSSRRKYKHRLGLRNGNESLSRQMANGDNHRLFLLPRNKHKNHTPFWHNLRDLD